MKRARLDADGTAKGVTVLRGTVREGSTIGKYGPPKATHVVLEDGSVVDLGVEFIPPPSMKTYQTVEVYLNGVRLEEAVHSAMKRITETHGDLLRALAKGPGEE